MTTDRPIVSRDAWIAARKEHLRREKEFTRLRDQLSAERRALPWTRVEKDYLFRGPDGDRTLAQLFGPRSQLIVYHFMMGADWEEGCKSCSFWTDNFQDIDVHLAARDVALLAVSTAPYDRIAAFRKRMGWTHEWVSCAGGDFNRDYHVSFTPEDLAAGEVDYNFRPIKTSMTELPGISVFFRDEDGTVYHTYSCYSRGLDMLNVAYHYLDLTPKGRHEDGLPVPMAWVKLHDRYGT